MKKYDVQRLRISILVWLAVTLFFLAVSSFPKASGGKRMSLVLETSDDVALSGSAQDDTEGNVYQYVNPDNCSRNLIPVVSAVETNGGLLVS
jgi:hypothetical protein